MVRYFDTWTAGVIRSTDVAGITYHPLSDHLYLADSEISEQPEHFVGDNVFETSRLGDQVFREIASNNDEPVGITYNQFDDYFYVVNDSTASVSRYDFDLDHPLAAVITTDSVSNAEDPEGITSDPVTGNLYVVDGNLGGKQVLVYNSSLEFQYSFSIARHVRDGEGIAFDPFSRHLFIVSGKDDAIFEYTVDGVYIQEYDIDDFPVEPDAPQGLTFAPTSDPDDDPAQLALYIADGMVDNYPDGRVFEAVLSGQQLINFPPSVSAGADQSVFVENFATQLVRLDGTVRDDSLPSPPAATSTLWTQVSGPDAVTFGDPTSVDTTVQFSQEGIFVLRLTADDGALVSSDELTIVVQDSSGTSTLAAPIQTRTDDVEEAASGNMNLTSRDLDLASKRVGLRFANLGIPAGATILHAYIQLEAKETSSTEASYTLVGEAADNSAAFAATSFNVTSRPATAASVAWAPQPWRGKNSTQQTADIAAVIQEIVSRPGWSAGNALSIIVTGTGHRAVNSFESKGTAAELHLRFSEGGQANRPPLVNAGSDRSLVLPDTAALSGTVADDGQPGPVTVTWSKVSGPGNVSFADPSALLTTAAFSAAGSYVLRLTASDGGLTREDDVQVVVFDNGTTNEPPEVEAGPDLRVFLPNSAQLSGQVTDEGLLRPVTAVWSKLAGPGDVTFDDAGAADTTAYFDTVGTYVLRLTANDGEFVVTDELNVHVVNSDDQVTVLDVSMATGADDVEESGAGGMDLTSKDLDLARRATGLRFDKVAVTSGARIVDAYIQFQADETMSVDTQVTVTGEAADNSAAFDETPFNLTSRSATSASVWWSIPVWEAGQIGPHQRTPNLSSIIEEIVSRPGWQSGNALSFMISGDGHRAAESFESGAAPQLHIEIEDNSLPPNQPPQVDAGLDQSVVFPHSAALDGTVSDDGQLGPLLTSWSLVAGPGAVTFAAANQVDTTATFSVAGTYVLRLSAEDGEFVSTDDVTVVVREQNSHVAVLDLGVSSSADDVEESGAGNVDLSSKDLDLGRRALAVRFAGVAIGPDATIVNAYLQFQADESGSKPAHVTVAAEAADNSTPFVEAPYNVTSRPTTTARVPWTISAWTAGEAGLNQRSPDISAIVQELVARPGWTAGNALSFIVTGDGQRAAESFDSGAGPRLHIEFREDTSPSNQPPQVDAGFDQSVSLPNTAALDGTVTDDGQLGALAISWSKTSGPGNVSFGSIGEIDTTAGFSHEGTYVLRLTADDGEFAAWDEVTINVSAGNQPGNRPPQVDAGFDLNVTLPNAAYLDGTVTDDGQPGPLTNSWSKTSGPGSVRFANLAAIDTSATFSHAGTYVLRLTAHDGQVAAWDEVTISVSAGNQPGNQPPQVDAGLDQSVTLPHTASLDGTVTDDSQLGPLTVSWSKTSGPGSVNFGNLAATDTTASFSRDGTYVLRLTAHDGELTAWDEVTVSVSAGTQPGNQPPQVDAGDDQTIVLPHTASLDGTVTDDGRLGPVTTFWNRVSGPGSVTFENLNAVDTTAEFSAAGTYVLRLTANDGQFGSSDNVTIQVESGGTQTTTLDLSVTASADDAEESRTGAVDLESSDLDLGKRVVGLRFAQVNVIRESTIVDAYLQFQADETQTAATQLTLRGEARDHSAAFSPTAFNISSRPLTNASASWNVAPWTVGEEGSRQRTGDLTAIIQEIVSQPGWTSGSALSIIVSGSGMRVAEPYDGNGSRPRLHIEYIPAAVATPVDQHADESRDPNQQLAAAFRQAGWAASILDDKAAVVIAAVDASDADHETDHHFGVVRSRSAVVDPQSVGWLAATTEVCGASSEPLSHCRLTQSSDLLQLFDETVVDELFAQPEG